MSILLPTSPGIRAGEPRLLDFGTILTPPRGGEAQRQNRVGNRFALDCTLPPAPSGGTGRVYVSKLLQAVTAGAIIAFPQHGLAIGNPGAPAADGASQSGSSLALRGFTAGYQVRDGQFFSVIVNGRRFLYCAAADVTANGAGKMTLPITPMIRRPPGDGAVCEFATPYLEGLLPPGLSWKLRTDPYTEIQFTISEAA